MGNTLKKSTNMPGIGVEMFEILKNVEKQKRFCMDCETNGHVQSIKYPIIIRDQVIIHTRLYGKVTLLFSSSSFTQSIYPDGYSVSLS